VRLSETGSSRCDLDARCQQPALQLADGHSLLLVWVARGLLLELSVTVAAGDLGLLRVAHCTLPPESAGNSIFVGEVTLRHRQAGCVRYCYLPLTSVVPRRFRCHPVDEAAATFVEPAFTSLDLRRAPRPRPPERRYRPVRIRAIRCRAVIAHELTPRHRGAVAWSRRGAVLRPLACVVVALDPTAEPERSIP
jgi:hypothetical protein